MGTFVQHLHTVLLGGDGRWQVDGYHLKKSITSWQPVAHDGLHQGLSLLVLVLVGDLDLELFHQLGGLVLFELHDGVKHLVDGVQDEHVETTDESFTSNLVPLLGLGVVELISPKTLHELDGLNLELGGVDLGKLLDGEGPVVQTGAETNGSLARVNLDVSHGRVLIGVGGDNDVHALNDTLEGLHTENTRTGTRNGEIPQVSSVKQMQSVETRKHLLSGNLLHPLLRLCACKSKTQNLASGPIYAKYPNRIKGIKKEPAFYYSSRVHLSYKALLCEDCYPEVSQQELQNEIGYSRYTRKSLARWRMHESWGTPGPSVTSRTPK